MSLIVFIAMAAAAALVASQFGPGPWYASAAEAVMDTTQLALRAGVVRAIYRQRRCRLVGVAIQSCQRYQADPALAAAGNSEWTLVMAFLRFAPARTGADRYYRAAYNHLLLYRHRQWTKPGCRLAVRSLCAMGRFRHRVEFCDMAVELVRCRETPLKDGS